MLQKGSIPWNRENLSKGISAKIYTLEIYMLYGTTRARGQELYSSTARGHDVITYLLHHKD